MPTIPRLGAVLGVPTPPTDDRDRVVVQYSTARVALNSAIPILSLFMADQDDGEAESDVIFPAEDFDSLSRPGIVTIYRQHWGV